MEDNLIDVELLDLEKGINGSYDRLLNDLEKGNGEGAWTHLVSPGKNTLLHVVANSREVDLASRLLSLLPHSSDVSSALLRQNTRGDTPLHCAARRGKDDFVDLFISKVSNIEDKTRLLAMKNKQGDTALHLATRNNHFQVVDKLMNEDADLGSIANNSGECPLYVAAYKGFLNITERLVESTATGPGGRTALHAAVAQRHQDVVDSLLTRRPELCRERDETGSTSLLCVASIGNISMVQALLDADISTVLLLDENGLSPLHVAAAARCINVLQEILGRRRDFWELIDNTGKTFLHVAIENRRIAVVKYVLKDVRLIEILNQPDYEGNTPLHLAVISSDLKIVRLLLSDNRVVLNNVNQKGQTPLDLAYSSTLDFPFKFEMVMISFDLRFFGMRKGPQRWDLDLKRRRNKIEERRDIKLRKALTKRMVILSALIVTLTFAAAFSLPRGTEQGLAFNMFLVFDTLAIVSSGSVILLLFTVEATFHDVSLQIILDLTVFVIFSILCVIIAFAYGVISVYAKPNRYWLRISPLIPLFLLIQMIWAYGVNPWRIIAVFAKDFRQSKIDAKRKKVIS